MRVSSAAPLVLSVLLALGCGSRENRAEGPDLAAALPVEKGMNVVVISFDALRADHLGSYGYPRPVSPVMDAFARSSVVFEDAWAASSSTPSSFAALFTGRSPIEVFRGWKLLRTATLASHFAASGYETAFISSNAQLVAARGFDQGFRHYELLIPKSEGEESVLQDLAILERALERLRTLEQPFLLWTHFLSPHSPYDYRDGSRHLYADGYAGPFETSSGPTFEAKSAADLDRLVQLYDGEIYFADQLFDRMLGAIASQGLEDNTLVVLTADHGEEHNDHGALQHNALHGEVLRVPLMIRHPARKVGSRTTVPASHVDVAPTLAAVAGLPPFDSASGVSLLEPVDADRLRIGVAMTHPTDHYVAAGRGTTKLIVECRERSVALFDTARDPAETRDLAAGQRATLRTLLADLETSLGARPCDALRQAVGGTPPTKSLTDEQIRQLEALGYLGGGSSDAAPAAATEAGRLWAEPNPIRDCVALGIGETTIHWDVGDEFETVEIRVLPANAVFAAGGSSGEANTGLWVKDGTGFAAVDASSGTVLAVTTVKVEGGCS